MKTVSPLAISYESEAMNVDGDRAAAAIAAPLGIDVGGTAYYGWDRTPRLRIDQSVRLFWGALTGLALAAIVLAWMGW